MGACNLRPLFFIFSYFLLFIFYCPGRPALPCPAPPLPCPCPCPALFRIFLLLPGTGGGSYTGNGQCFFFLLLPGTGGGSYTGNGQCFFFLLLLGTGGGSYTLPCKTDRQTDRHCRRPPLPSRDLDFKTWSCPSVEVLKPRSAPGRTDRRTDTILALIYKMPC